MKKQKLSISVIKYNALKLRANRQLPFYLCKLIQGLNGNEGEGYIKYLITCSEHFLRIKNYYKKYPLADEEATKLIKEDLQKLGY